LRALGAQGGQGNYLGQPLTLAQALTLVCESDAGVAAV
jgi:EAL domain-containing protein (putative c-di-GMP-specific phosphodiesterase class I)